MPFSIDYIKFWLGAANSKGHGTHSPFVYDFIINVLNDKRSFYSFNQLQQQRKKIADKEQINPLKIDELLFRMVDYYKIKSLGTINANSITESYLVKANDEIEIIKTNPSNEISNNKLDMIYVDVDNEVENFSSLISLCQTKSLIIINRNHNNSNQQKIWVQLINDSRINTTMDLYHLGIGVINHDIKVKQHFNIRY